MTRRGNPRPERCDHTDVRLWPAVALLATTLCHASPAQEDDAPARATTGVLRVELAADPAGTGPTAWVQLRDRLADAAHGDVPVREALIATLRIRGNGVEVVGVSAGAELPEHLYVRGDLELSDEDGHRIAFSGDCTPTGHARAHVRAGSLRPPHLPAWRVLERTLRLEPGSVHAGLEVAALCGIDPGVAAPHGLSGPAPDDALPLQTVATWCGPLDLLVGDRAVMTDDGDEIDDCYAAQSDGGLLLPLALLACTAPGLADRLDMGGETELAALRATVASRTRRFDAVLQLGSSDGALHPDDEAHRELDVLARYGEGTSRTAARLGLSPRATDGSTRRSTPPTTFAARTGANTNPSTDDADGRSRRWRAAVLSALACSCVLLIRALLVRRIDPDPRVATAR